MTQPTKLLVQRQSFLVASASRRQAIDITPSLRDGIRVAEVRNGVVLANCLHTTCSVLIADSGAEAIDDFVRLMGHFIEDGCPYRHNDPRWSDCERGNAAAHLRASLLGHGVAIGITESELALDPSQSILLAEWDGPRSRTVDIQILGA